MTNDKRARYVPKLPKKEINIDEEIQKKKLDLQKKSESIKEKIEIRDNKERENIFEKIRIDLDKIEEELEKNGKNKEYIKLSQFIRFYKLVEKENFDVKEKKEIENFIKKQKEEREIAVKFYNYIEQNIMKNSEGDEKELNKTKFDLISKYLKYKNGEERIREKVLK